MLSFFKQLDATVHVDIVYTRKMFLVFFSKDPTKGDVFLPFCDKHSLKKCLDWYNVQTLQNGYKKEKSSHEGKSVRRKPSTKRDAQIFDNSSLGTLNYFLHVLDVWRPSNK